MKTSLFLPLFALLISPGAFATDYQGEVSEILYNSIENATHYDDTRIKELRDRIMAGDAGITVRAIEAKRADLVMLYDLSQTKGEKPNAYLTIELFDSKYSEVITLKNAIPARLTFHGVQVDMSFATFTKFKIREQVKLRKLSGDVCSGANISWVIGGGKVSCRKAGVSMSFTRGGAGISLGASKATLTIFPFVFQTR